MSTVSDPNVGAAARLEIPFVIGDVMPSPLLRAPALPVARPLHERVWAYVTVGLVAVAVAARFMASMLAIPLDTPGGAAAPTWLVEVTTNNAETGTALVYGREVGLQFVQVPPGEGSTSNARLVPARLAKGELHLLSLGLSSLRVHTSAPRGASPMTFGATSHIISASQTKTKTGVRGW